MRIVMAFALAALMGPGAGLASAQTPDERIERARARARAGGIPTELLDTKIAEGRAKGVPMERIAAAVERRQEALERAQQALRDRPDVGPADLSVGADAVESGVSEAVLRALGELAPRDRRAVAIAALDALVQLGHEPGAALERVRSALDRGPEALLNLPAEVGRPSGRPGVRPPVERPEGAPAGVRPPAGVPPPGAPPQGARPEGVPTPGRPGGVPPR